MKTYIYGDELIRMEAEEHNGSFWLDLYTKEVCLTIFLPKHVTIEQAKSIAREFNQAIKEPKND